MPRMVALAVLLTAAAGPLHAQPMFSHSSIVVDGAGNEVLEPSETAAVEPSWRNVGFTPPTLCNLGGALGSFSGPAGATYEIVDGAGHYAGCFVPQGPPVPCSDCYSVRITAGARPALHWDTTILEGPAGIQSSWVLHVGATFDDVTAASPFYRFVETIVHENVTGGCTATAYCPAASVTREQMAVFVLLAKEAPGYMPPACGTPALFADVSSSSPFCPWIEELARRGVVGGCGSGNYCPAAAVARDTMAVFVLRTANPALNPPACTAPMFADVPAASPFCRWIEELARRGVVGGCGGGNYCPSAAVTREQVSVFLAMSFGLTLYAP